MQEEELTYQIIGCAMKVHNFLGCGFQEVIYQRALAIELERSGINFKREVECPIYYDRIEVGSRRADFIVAEKVVVELKALTALEPVHIAQAKNYLEAFNLEVGLLINFGGESLENHRLFNSKNPEPGFSGL